MQCLVLYLCALPVLVSARVTVELNAHKDDLDKPVNLVGKSIELIKRADITYFQLDDIALREKIGNFFGSRPDDIYLKGPTPYGDMYTAFGWHPVTKIMQAKEAKIITINSGPNMISTQIYQNDDDEKVTFESLVSYPVQNSLVSTWVKETDLVTMEDEVRYSFNINGSSVSGVHEIQYTGRFGQDYNKAFPARIGSRIRIQVNLDPNKKVIAELYANKETMSIQIDYQITLDGYVAANYENSFHKHHFWSFYIYDLLNYAKLRPYVIASEIIDINYYTDPILVLRDTHTNKELYSIPMNFI